MNLSRIVVVGCQLVYPLATPSGSLISNLALPNFVIDVLRTLSAKLVLSVDMDDPGMRQRDKEKGSIVEPRTRAQFVLKLLKLEY